jgi:hypothetical protein
MYAHILMHARIQAKSYMYACENAQIRIQHKHQINITYGQTLTHTYTHNIRTYRAAICAKLRKGRRKKLLRHLTHPRTWLLFCMSDSTRCTRSCASTAVMMMMTTVGALMTSMYVHTYAYLVVSMDLRRKQAQTIQTLGFWCYKLLTSHRYTL